MARPSPMTADQQVAVMKTRVDQALAVITTALSQHPGNKQMVDVLLDIGLALRGGAR